MDRELLEGIVSALERIADAVEKLESKGIMVWIGEQKPEDN